LNSTRVESGYCNITVIDKQNVHNSEEFRIKHGLHQLIKAYREKYGDYETRQLMEELIAYQSVRVH
jgi:hypothetical protein